MLLGTLTVSLLGNMLSGKGLIWAHEVTITASQGGGKIFNAALSFN